MGGSNKEHQIQEERGLWKASAYIHRIAVRFRDKNLPLRISYIQEAHKLIFLDSNLKDIGGKFRTNDPYLTRVDGSELRIINWTQIPAQIAIFNEELVYRTKELKRPSTKKGYAKIIDLAAKLSHRFACIHPFENGNGRASRLLINFVLIRAGLHEITLTDDKERYLRSMLQADRGDYEPLRKLVIEGLIKTTNKIVERQKNLRAEGKKKQKRMIFHASDFK